MQAERSTGAAGGQQVSTRGSELRARMVAQMAEKGLAETTQRMYVSGVVGLVRHYGGRRPETVSVAEARAYIARLKDAGVSTTFRSNASAGIRFLYETTLGQAWRPPSPLRQRVLEDMALRGFTAKTQSSYVRAVEGLARFHRRSPERLSDEEIRRYFVHLKCERRLARPTITIALCGIKFFYESTLRRDFSVTGVPRPKREHKLPVVLSREEVRAILGKITERRHRACLTLIYACGLRLGEGCRVQVTDLDRARGVLHVHAAKGAKDRYVPLPAPVLPLLETCWFTHRNPVWLFPSVGRGGVHGATATSPVPLGTVQQVFRAALAVCHTPALGAVRWHCPRCGEALFTYRSCGNRHCPACGHADAQLWLTRQQRLLLPGVTYHLVTFTVPESLRRPFRAHPRELLPLLFDASASALLDLCREPRFLGAVPALTAALHTWTRQMLYHPHAHFLASGGGLDASGAWRAARPTFLVPVHALSSIFRARLRDALRDRQPALFATLAPGVWRKPWVVHSKPVGSGDKALAYLARYIFRVALADAAILHHAPSTSSGQGAVVFRYRDGPTGQPRTARLVPQEFIRRFLQHVLPAGFRKVRHYGLHHSSKRKALRLLQAQLAFTHRLPLPPADKPSRPPLPPRPCPKCATPMCAERALPPTSTCTPQATARGPP